MDLRNLPLLPAGDPIYLGMLDGYQLAAPQSFWLSSPDQIKEVVGGCGPGGFGDYLVPDTVYFLSIRAACKIHDWMYLVYNCEAGFKLANTVFLDNMNRINKAGSGNRITRTLRAMRIRKYYLAVKQFGRLAYYDSHLRLYEQDELYA